MNSWWKRTALYVLVWLAAGAGGDEDVPVYAGLITQVTGEHTEDAALNLEQIENTYGRAVVKITFNDIDNLHEIKDDPRQQEDCDSYDRGQGSGFFINDEGFIMTNAHVVSTANRRTLKCRSHLTGNTEFELQLIGLGDEDEIDLAILRLDPKDRRRFLKLAGLESIPYLKIGRSTGVSKTEEIAILGYPEDSDDLRAKQAHLSGWEFPNGDDGDFLFLEVATASAVMSGNSGGAAVNRFGELIGIPSLADWDESTGYLIPTHVITHFIDQIANNQQGRLPVQSLWTGIIKERTFPGMAVMAGLPEDYLDYEIGMTVFRVIPGSPAARWGLRPGDLILRFRNHVNGQCVNLDYEGRVKTTGKMRIIEENGQTWDNSEFRKATLGEMILLSRPGDRVTIEYARVGATGIQTIDATLAYWDPMPVTYLGVFEVPDYEEWGGMILQDINSFNLSFGTYIENRDLFHEGLLVITQVDGGSLADERGISSFVTALNGRRVRNLEELREALAAINADFNTWKESPAYDEETARYDLRSYVNLEYLVNDIETDKLVPRLMTFPIEKARETGRSLDTAGGEEDDELLEEKEAE